MSETDKESASREGEDHEDGEITDDDDEAPLEITSHSEANRLSLDYASSDDEPSEDLINQYAKKIEENQKQEPEIDPKLCKVCKKVEHKYRCPRCDLRTCSLDCSKQHKIDFECDGVRQAFTKVEKLSQYDAQKSIDDQKFMHNLKEKIGLGAETTTTNEVTTTDSEPADKSDLRYTTNSGTERYLLNAARFRHIWLGFSNEPQEIMNESRHEQFSDTVFWTLKLVFKKQLEDGSVDEFVKVVHNIPETIRITTILKQFFKPRKFGCIVSESDLDTIKLAKFIERGQEEINVYMEVHGHPDKYYGCLSEKTFLENTRNRVIADHPKLIITLNDEFRDMQLLSGEEMEQISAKYGGVAKNERYNRNGGGGRGNGGGMRGFGRGGRGGGGMNRGGKRPHQGGFDNSNNWKRGRGGPRRGGFNHRGPADNFDPFEPFAGPTRLPMEYCDK